MRRLTGVQFVQKMVIATFVGAGSYVIADTVAAPTPSPAAKSATSVHSDSASAFQVDPTSESQVNEAVTQPDTLGTDASASHTELTINGQSIEVPANSSVNETVNNGNGTTSVSVTNRNTSSGGASGSNHTQLNIHSSSNSSSSVANRERESNHSR